MIKFVKVFTIRVLYKSGQTQDFDCTKFEYEINVASNKVSWEAFGKVKPLLFNIEEVSAIYKVKEKRKLKFF